MVMVMMVRVMMIRVMMIRVVIVRVMMVMVMMVRVMMIRVMMIRVVIVRVTIVRTERVMIVCVAMMIMIRNKIAMVRGKLMEYLKIILEDNINTGMEVLFPIINNKNNVLQKTPTFFFKITFWSCCLIKATGLGTIYF